MKIIIRLKKPAYDCSFNPPKPCYIKVEHDVSMINSDKNTLIIEHTDGTTSAYLSKFIHNIIIKEN